MKKLLLLIMFLFSFNAAAASLEFSWIAPVYRADNITPLILSEIGGYHIYYGSTSGSYVNDVNIPDNTLTNFVLPNMAPGDYYSVMTAYDVDGRESAYSSEVVVSIIPPPKSIMVFSVRVLP